MESATRLLSPVDVFFLLVYTEWDMMSPCESNRKLRLKKIFLPSNGTTNYVQSTRSSVFARCGLWSFTGGGGGGWG